MSKYYKKNLNSKNDIISARVVWGVNEELHLTELFEKGYCVDIISTLHGRTNSAIAARLVKLSLIDKRSDFYARRRTT